MSPSILCPLTESELTAGDCGILLVVKIFVYDSVVPSSLSSASLFYEEYWPFQAAIPQTAFLNTGPRQNMLHCDELIVLSSRVVRDMRMDTITRPGNS